MPITNPNYFYLTHEEIARKIGLKEKHMPILISTFLEETSSLLDRLEDLVETLNYSEIEAKAHSIKGSAGNLCFNDISEMAKEMELAAREKNSSFEYTAYFEAIKKAVSTIKN